MANIMDTICNLAGRIKTARRRLGWSQEKLAEMADIDRKTVSRFEDGAHDVKLHCIHAMLVALGIQTCEVCTGCRDNQPQGTPPQSRQATDGRG